MSLPTFDLVNPNKSRQLRSRLMLLATLFMLAYGVALSLAPSVRTHDASATPLWQHWIGILAWLIGFLLLTDQINRVLPTSNPFILPLTAILSGWGLMTIWRLSTQMGLKQTVWLSLGIILVLVGLRIQNLSELLRRYKYVWLTLGIILTFLTLFLGVNPYGTGPRLWLPVFNIYFQPSEPLKLLLIIYLSAFFSDYHRTERRFLPSILPTIVMAVLTCVLLIAQHDLGTASILIFIYVIMLMITTQRRRLLWMVPLLFILASFVAYQMSDIVKLRIDTWLDPWQNTDGSSYQIVQGLIAIASGGFSGTGPGLGSPGLIPVAVSDFIFSAIAEEFGLIGSTALLLLFMLFTFHSIKISMAARANFQRYLALGIGAYFAIQSFLIIGGNLGMLPLTGVTLPFLSYGGSSLLTNLVCMLLLLKISAEDEIPLSKPVSVKPFAVLGMIFSGMFLIAILVNGYITIWQGKELILRAENPRWSIYDRYIPRGSLVDSNEEPLVETIGESGSYARQILHVPLSNTIGYTNAVYGQSGLEASLYAYLRGLTGLPYQTIWWHQRLYNQPPPGLDIKLTVNLPLQKAADQLMQGTNSAVVLMNAMTGEIYVIASYPYFDASTLDADWSSLVSDSSSPLLNRATQGAYPLGTASIPILLAGIAENNAPSLSSLDISSIIDKYCYPALQDNDSPLPGVQFGCNQAYSELTALISGDDLLKTTGNLGFFTVFDFQLPISLIDPTPSEIVDPKDFFMDNSSFLVSPLQMARLASALTNQGELPIPTLVNSYKNEVGEWITFPVPEKSAPVLSSYTTSQITNLLQAGSSPYWFNTGHATDLDGQIITWYIGGTLPEWQGSPLAVAIVLEENEPRLAQEIGELLLTGSSSN